MKLYSLNKQLIGIIVFILATTLCANAQVLVTETIKLRDKTVTVDLKSKALRKILFAKGIKYADFDAETYCFTIAYNPQKLSIEHLKTQLELVLNEKGRRTQESISAYHQPDEHFSLF